MTAILNRAVNRMASLDRSISQRNILPHSACKNKYFLGPKTRVSCECESCFNKKVLDTDFFYAKAFFLEFNVNQHLSSFSNDPIVVAMYCLCKSNIYTK